MLKISEERNIGNTITLRLEGRVAGPWAAELLQVCDLLLAGGTKVSIDLAEVSFADANGLAVLNSLGRRGAGLLGQTPFLAEQLTGSRPSAP